MQAPLRIVDSITELQTSDAGCIAVSGSHGGISSATYAAAAKPLLSVFNDAGVGKDAAGIAGLAFLQERGLAACTVAHSSARIGVAQSSLHEGIVSHVNEAAHALGVRVGHTCTQVVAALQGAGASEAATGDKP
jgi:Na+/phosphate symporter